jgi:tetratricopeptide (TPR) repeat protein
MNTATNARTISWLQALIAELRNRNKGALRQNLPLLAGDAHLLPWYHWFKAQLALLEGQSDVAEEELARVVTVNPSFLPALALLWDLSRSSGNTWVMQHIENNIQQLDYSVGDMELLVEEYSINALKDELEEAPEDDLSALMLELEEGLEEGKDKSTSLPGDADFGEIMDRIYAHEARKSPKIQQSGEEKRKIATATLGEIFIAQGKIDEAVSVFEKLLKGDPENQAIQRKLNELKRL